MTNFKPHLNPVPQLTCQASLESVSMPRFSKLTIPWSYLSDKLLVSHNQLTTCKN